MTKRDRLLMWGGGYSPWIGNLERRLCLVCCNIYLHVLSVVQWDEYWDHVMYFRVNFRIKLQLTVVNLRKIAGDDNRAIVGRLSLRCLMDSAYPLLCAICQSVHAMSPKFQSGLPPVWMQPEISWKQDAISFCESSFHQISWETNSYFSTLLHYLKGCLCTGFGPLSELPLLDFHPMIWLLPWGLTLFFMMKWINFRKPRSLFCLW